MDRAFFFFSWRGGLGGGLSTLGGDFFSGLGGGGKWDRGMFNLDLGGGFFHEFFFFFGFFHG